MYSVSSDAIAYSLCVCINTGGGVRPVVIYLSACPFKNFLKAPVIIRVVSVFNLYLLVIVTSTSLYKDSFSISS